MGARSGMFRSMLAAVAILCYGCDVVDPTLLSGPVEEGVSSADLINASVVVLQTQGYTVVAADREAGVVTTAWRDESSFAGQVFLETSRRTRISVVVDFYSKNVTVQMTKQVKEGDTPWRNDDLSGKDHGVAQDILAEIQERARDISNKTRGSI